MRKVKVPVDTSSEQKSILGIMSVRQLIYCIIGGSIIYSISPFFWKLGPSLYIKFMLVVLSALPIIAVLAPLAFMKNQKYNMFYDMYLWTRLMRHKEKGVWRRGSKPKAMNLERG